MRHKQGSTSLHPFNPKRSSVFRKCPDWIKDTRHVLWENSLRPLLVEKAPYYHGIRNYFKLKTDYFFRFQLALSKPPFHQQMVQVGSSEAEPESRNGSRPRVGSTAAHTALGLPLWRIARVNSPWLALRKQMVPTQPAPAAPPNKVAEYGSPPQMQQCSLTPRWEPRRWSNRPALPLMHLTFW